VGRTLRFKAKRFQKIQERYHQPLRARSICTTIVAETQRSNARRPTRSCRRQSVPIGRRRPAGTRSAGMSPVPVRERDEDLNASPPIRLEVVCEARRERLARLRADPTSIRSDSASRGTRLRAAPASTSATAGNSGNHFACPQERGLAWVSRKGRLVQARPITTGPPKMKPTRSPGACRRHHVRRPAAHYKLRQKRGDGDPLDDPGSRQGGPR